MGYWQWCKGAEYILLSVCIVAFTILIRKEVWLYNICIRKDVGRSQSGDRIRWTPLHCAYQYITSSLRNTSTSTYTYTSPSTAQINISRPDCTNITSSTHGANMVVS